MGLGVSDFADFADDYLLGLLAVRQGYISQAQLDDAVSIRIRSIPTPRLFEVVAELGRIPHDALDRITDLHKTLLFGSIALGCGWLTPTQLCEALEIQRRSDPKPLLGEVLIALGFISRRTLQQILSMQENSISRVLLPSPSQESLAHLTKQLRLRRQLVRSPLPPRSTSNFRIGLGLAAGVAFLAFIGWLLCDRGPDTNLPEPPLTAYYNEQQVILSRAAMSSRREDVGHEGVFGIPAPGKRLDLISENKDKQFSRAAGDAVVSVHPTPQPVAIQTPNESVTSAGAVSNPESSRKSSVANSPKLPASRSGVLPTPDHNAGLSRREPSRSYGTPHSVHIPSQDQTNNNRIISIRSANGIFHCEWDATTYPSYIVSATYDDRGRLWLGTEDHGVWTIDPAPSDGVHVRQFTMADGLGDDSVYALSCDKAGRIWAGHLKGGISIYSGDTWRRYGIEEGLLGERIFSIAANPFSGDVWIATSWGLCRYIAASDSWQSFTRADGLPSDQIQCLALTTDGTLLAGTQCNGVAIGKPRGSYVSWTTVRSPAGGNKLIPPQGEGLPTDQINDILVTRGGTIYAATTLGLAWSANQGVTWNYLRGNNWADRARMLYCSDNIHRSDRDALIRQWSAFKGRLLSEDYVTSLAEDAGGRIWIGHRITGYDILDPKADRLEWFPDASTIKSILGGKDHYAYALFASPQGDCPLISWYGQGLTQSRAWPVSTTWAQKAGTSYRSNVQAPVFPSRVALWSRGDLERVSEAANRERKKSWNGVMYAGEDWTTRGDWMGRYGRCYAMLCGLQSPISREYSAAELGYQEVFAVLGPNAYKDDGNRNWVHWLKTDNPKSLFDPILNYRRQAEWDDHGEAYPIDYDGPDLWIRVNVPRGFHRVSLYFFNKDGHDGRNRYRDYIIRVRPWSPLIGDDKSLPVLAESRVRDFWGGVYKMFYVTGPTSYWFQVDRNYSFNAIVSGVFIDRCGENDRVVSDWSLIAPRWRYDYPAFDFGSANAVPEARALWLAANEDWSLKGTLARRVRAIAAYRVMTSNLPADASGLAHCRWNLGLWNDGDQAAHSFQLKFLSNYLLAINKPTIH